MTASVCERCSRLPSSKGRTVEENDVVQLRSDLLRLENRGRIVRRVPADLNPNIPCRSERRESRESLYDQWVERMNARKTHNDAERGDHVGYQGLRAGRRWW